MSPVIMALVSAGLQTISQIIDGLQSGQITEAQAQAFLEAQAQAYNSAVANWDATKAPAGPSNG